MGPVIHDGLRVRIHYRIALRREDLDSDRVVDSSDRYDEPIVAVLGTGELLAGVEHGLQGCRVGETRLLIIPPEYAYGEKGVPGCIPPSATLFVEVTISTKTNFA
jgi:FKBP-type peptidyl-prolyl cis-trans isomerase